MASSTESFFQRLSRIFRSGPAIRKRVKGYDAKSFYSHQLIQGNYGYRASAPFGFGRENSPFSVLGQYGILDRMARYCLAGDMRIAINTPEGNIRLDQLVDEYTKNPEKKYYTFSYDIPADSIVCSPIKHAFYTKTDEIVEVYLDSGAKIRCTKEHPLMLRDGTYCLVQDLKPGMALMPFYRKELKKYSRHNPNRYRSIYSFSEKWKAEHKIVAEHKFGKKILPEHDLHVHHKNFMGTDNRIENLDILPSTKHLSLHAKNATRSSQRISKRHHDIALENIGQIKAVKHNTGRSLTNKVIRYPNCSQTRFKNPNVDKAFSIETIRQNWTSNIMAQALAKKCGVHYGKFLSRIKWGGYETYVDFVRDNFDPSYNLAYKKPRHLFELPTIQEVYNKYQKGTTSSKLSKKLGITPECLLTILRRNNYLSWYDFVNSYRNHKVVKIVFTEKQEKVYDITVEPHHNFAIYDESGKSSIISHNSEFAEMDYTPEIATAMDIYADETVGGDDRGKCFHIYSDNAEIKNALDDLFYDVLNVEFNLKPWIRNLPVKHDTLIPLLSGETITIKELSERLLEKKEAEEWVYSIQDKTKKIVPGKVIWCGKNYTSNKIVRVTLDNGSFVETAPEHPFLLRNGKSKRADELQSKDSLMPFYTRLSKKSEAIQGYEKVYNPRSDYFKFTHRMVSEECLLTEETRSIDKEHRFDTHHKNFKKLNNCPNNLVRLSSVEHRKLHGKNIKKYLRDPEVTKKRMTGIDRYLRSPERRKYLSEKMKGIYPDFFKEYNQSELHKEHNIIRSKAMKGFWKDSGKAQKASQKMKISFDQKCLEFIWNWIEKERKFIGLKPMCKLLFNDKSFLEHFYGINSYSGRDLGKSLNTYSLQNFVKRLGYKNYSQMVIEKYPELVDDRAYKISASSSRARSKRNHTVLSVEVIEELSDVYCMTVVGPNNERDRHNFAICGKRKDGTFERDGVFVQNCKYGDFFLYNEVHPDIGIIQVTPIPVNEIEREEGYDLEDPYAVRFKWLTRGNKYLENWQITHLRVLNNDLFLPYGTSLLEPVRRIWRQLCHSKETPVWIKDEGWKKIQDVKPGEIVLSYDYKKDKLIETKVKHCAEMGIQKLVKVQTAHRQIEVTPNHGLLVKTKSGNLLYKKAEDLIVSEGKGGWSYNKADQLILPKIVTGTPEHFITIPEEKYKYKIKDNSGKLKYSILNETEIKLYREKAKEKKNIYRFLNGDGKLNHEQYKTLLEVKPELKDKLEVETYYSCSPNLSLFKPNQKVNIANKDFMRFFGFMHGDGWANRASRNIGFALGEYEEQNKYYINLFEKLFDIVSRRTKPKKGTKSAQVYYPSVELCDFFTVLNFKTGFANKRIPSWVFSLTPELKVEFIRGLHDADGSKNDGRISLSNKGLIEDVKTLCQQAGISVGGEVKLDRKASRKYDKSFDKIIERKASYRLYVNLDKVSKEDVVFETVTRVEPIESDLTYDLQVEHECHNFVANGVVSHNTMLEDAMLVYRVARSAERRVFYIDVGNVAPNDVPNYMEAAQATLRSRGIVDKETGREDQRLNPMAMTDDYFIPVRGSQQGTRIETLAGGQHVTATEDVEYIQSKMFAALKVPKPYMNFDEHLCLVGDTKIPLLDGRTMAIEKLAEEFKVNNGGQNFVYSTKLDGMPVPGRIKNCWKTKEIDRLVHVTLDNGETIKCTENHPFLLRNGKYVRADELQVNDSLMPFRRKLSSKEEGDLIDGYEMVWDNKKGDWEYTHKFVAEEHINKKNGGFKIKKQRVIHHENCNKLDNSPNNLKEMHWYQHRKWHSEHLETTLLRPDVMEKSEIARLKWLSSEEHKAMSSVQMKKELVTPGRPLYEYIHSEEHALGQSAIMKKRWKDPEYREAQSKRNKEIVSRPEVKEKLSGKNHWEVRAKAKYDLKWLLRYCQDNDVMERRHFLCAKKSGSPIGINVLQRIFEENGIEGWRDFSKNYLFYNHKISDVQIVEYKKLVSVYDLEVEEFHNFALNSGVYVHNSAKASLAQMDVRFSRTIQNLQKIVIAELNKIAMIHLFSMGFDGADLVDFELKLSNPSSVALQQKLELWSVKFDTGGSAKETKLVDEKWIQKNILELTDMEIGDIEKGLRKDKIREIEIEAIEVQEPDETQPSKTTDIFDPTNYEVPGSDVKKEPPKEEGKEEEEIQPNDLGLAKIKSYDEEGNQFVTDLEPGKTPIMATPFMTRHKRNRKRRVGVGRGRDNMSLPNMAAMLSAKNKYAADIHGQRTEAIEYDKTSENDKKEPDYRIELEPKFGREMESLFKKLREVIKKKKANSLLTEDIEIEIDLEDQETKLVDENTDAILQEIAGDIESNDDVSVLSDVEKGDSNNDVDDETVDEKTLNEVFNGNS